MPRQPLSSTEHILNTLSLLNTMTVNEVSKHTKIDRQTIYNWIRKYNPNKIKPKTQKELVEERLRKAKPLDSTTHQRIQEIVNVCLLLRESFTPREVSEITGMPLPTVIYWKKTQNIQSEKHKRSGMTRSELVSKILQNKDL